MEELARPRFPDYNATISTAGNDSLARRIPACREQVPFHARWRSIVSLQMSIKGCERSNVPGSNR